MSLWWVWYECVASLRSSCSRQRSFYWMVVVLAGLSIRSEVAGVSSIIRALGLRGGCYRRLLHLCHSSALSVARLRASWIGLVRARFTPRRIGGRLVVIGDGLKVPKEGRKMPAVKKLYQSSDNNSKAEYIFGHSFQALGLLVIGAAQTLCCVPLTSAIHEGVVFSNRDRRTLLDRFAELGLQVAKELGEPIVLLADAYYASAKVLRPLLNAGHHVLCRVKSNAVAYRPAPVPKTPQRGRPRVYGEKVRFRDLWRNSAFETLSCTLYGERDIEVRSLSLELLWRPVGQLVRFVLVDHPSRGRWILLCTDLTLSAQEIIEGYSYRFKIEACFKSALATLGTYAYHFWMQAMTPRPRRSGNQYLHRTSDDYRRLVRRKLDAYHRYVQLGCIAQGLLQYLALYYHTQVWRLFRSWLRTMKPALPPSEAVVAQALRNTLPEFLLDAPQDHTWTKFVLENTDYERCPSLRLAA
jgi:hypothetical protein